jgi:hypothetical protein
MNQARAIANNDMVFLSYDESRLPRPCHLPRWPRGRHDGRLRPAGALRVMKVVNEKCYSASASGSAHSVAKDLKQLSDELAGKGRIRKSGYRRKEIMTHSSDRYGVDRFG